MVKFKEKVGTFEEECIVIDLLKEYKGSTSYCGTEKFGIVTRLSEETLIKLYSSELEPYIPFIILTREMYEVIRESHLYEEREKKRRTADVGHFTPELEEVLADTRLNPVRLVEAMHFKAWLFDKIRALPNSDSWFLKRYIYGESVKQIAEEYGVNKLVVYRSLQKSRATMYNEIKEWRLPYEKEYY